MSFADQDDLVVHVAAHLGATKVESERACEVVLGAVAGWLSPADRELFVRELPSSFRAGLEHANASVALPIEERLVALGLTLGLAREVIASVCHVLGEHLSDDLLARLQRSLPGSVAAFLVRPLPGAIGTSRAARRYDTLAEGRPGSHAPVSAARADRRQQASVAADNPHGEIKLSSAAGTTQEREHEDLADGHPATHPIATSRD